MTACINKLYSILGFKMRLNWLQLHHLYYGIALMVGALFTPTAFAIPLFRLGVYIAGDDIYQHHRQVFEFNPCYHSPIHRFIYDYLKLYDRAWFRALNKFGDWLFANPILILIVIVAYVFVKLLLKG